MENTGYGRNYKYEDYGLVEASNGKMRQSCVAQVQINPEEAPELFERNYDLVFGGSVYDDYYSGEPTSLPNHDASYYVPSSDFEFKEVETSSSMFQEFTSAEFYYQVSDLDLTVTSYDS